jgi:hypothetical protein
MLMLHLTVHVGLTFLDDSAFRLTPSAHVGDTL